MKNTLRMTYTVCYDTKCMHNSNKKCKRAIPLGDCRRRERYMREVWKDNLVQRGFDGR